MENEIKDYSLLFTKLNLEENTPNNNSSKKEKDNNTRTNNTSNHHVTILKLNLVMTRPLNQITYHRTAAM